MMDDKGVSEFFFILEVVDVCCSAAMTVAATLRLKLTRKQTIAPIVDPTTIKMITIITRFVSIAGESGEWRTN